MARRSPPDPVRRALLAGAAASLAGAARAQDGLTVFAAASLKPPLDEIAAAWDVPVAIAYAGSGTVARQVAAGAPADLVLLAATDWMDWIVAQDLVDGASVAVASNALAVASAAGAGPVALQVGAILARLGDGRLGMGDPMSVPAGRYAQQALETLGLWSALEPRLLLAGDVRAVLAYVARGDVPLGLVYRSDLVGAGVEEAAAIPASAHAPIVYPGAVIRGAAPGAAALLARIAASGDVFARHGFAPAPPA